jgi:hypothetical protein
MEHQEFNELIERNIPKFRGKGFVCSGYPKIGSKRRKVSIHSVINWRSYAVGMRKRFEAIMSKFTPEQILEKMKSSNKLKQ